MRSTRNALRATAQRKGPSASVVPGSATLKGRIPSNRWVNRKLAESFADCGPIARALVAALLTFAKNGPWLRFTCSMPQLERMGFARTSIKRALREICDPRRAIYVERMYIPGGGDFSSKRRRYCVYRLARRNDWLEVAAGNDNATARPYGPAEPDELQWHEMRRQAALLEERERRWREYRAGRAERAQAGLARIGEGGEQAPSKVQNGPLCVPVPPPKGAPVPGTPPNHSGPLEVSDPARSRGTQSDDAPSGAESRARALDGRDASRDGHERATGRGVAPPDPLRRTPLGGLPPNAPPDDSPRLETPSSPAVDPPSAPSLVDLARAARIERQAAHEAQKRAELEARIAAERERRREHDRRLEELRRRGDS